MTTPNHLNQPNPNVLPPYGDVQPPHEWPGTAQGINDALADIRESTRQYNATVRENYEQYNHLPQNIQDAMLQAALKGRDFAAEHEVHLDYIRDTARVEDTEQILGLLRGEQLATAAERQQVDGATMDAITAHDAADNQHTANNVLRQTLRRQRAIEGPVPTMAAADKTRLQVLRDERMHHKGGVIGQIPVVGEHLGSHLNYALNVPGWIRLNREEQNLTVLETQYNNLKRTRNLQDTSVNYPHSLSADQELLARGRVERARQDRARLGEFDTIVEDLFDEINNRRITAVANFNSGNNVANSVHNRWELGQRAPHPSSRMDVRDALHDMGQAMGELSPRDPAYRAALSRFVQQTVRLEERDILHYLNDPHSAPMPSSEFTPDGGVLVHTGTPEEAVFFSDGSIARPDGSPNPADWPRRNTAGREINPAPQEGWPHITEELGRAPLQDVFNSWESCRSPETAARLHAELGFHTNRLQAQEGNYLAELGTIPDRIDALDTLMIDQGLIAADTNRSDIERDAARDAIRQAATDKRDLTVREGDLRNDLGNTHAQLTPLLYQRMRLTVTNDGRMDTPTMTPGGAIFQNMELYRRDGGRGRSRGRGGLERHDWALLPDGRSVWPQINPSTGQIVMYKVHNPDGTFRENSHNPF